MRPSRLFPVLSAFASVLASCGGGTEPRIGPPSSITAATSSAPASAQAGTVPVVTLTAKVADAAGQGVSGVAVSWSTGSGTITPSSVTDGNGQATAQWTPGNTAGGQTATASIPGVAGSTSFSIQITAGPLAKLKVTPDTVKLAAAGDTARVIVSGADAFDNPVPATGATLSFASDDPLVATVDNAGLVTGKGIGTTTIRATAGSATGSTAATVRRPPCFGLSGSPMTVGQVLTLSGAAASELCVQGASGAEFTAIPFFSSFQGPSTSLVVEPANTVVASGPPVPSVASASRASVQVSPREPSIDYEFEQAFQERWKRDLTPLIPAARLAARQQRSGARFNISAAVQSVGDLVDLNVNGNDGCTTPIIHTARVMAVSNNAIVMNDTLNPAGGLTTSDYQSFAVSFDTLVYPTDTRNFGTPTDIDGNGKVILLFTRAVNELTPKSNTTSFIAGFFFGRDLFPKTDSQRAQACPTSNFAEMFYLLAPDPDGTINNHPYSLDRIQKISVGVMAHEFEHLINSSRSLYVNTQTARFEETFLDEGLAHVAEELTFYQASGLGPKQNIDAAKLGSSTKISDAANSYQVSNQRRFRDFLKDPETNSPYAANDNLATRGATWSLLRYLADRKGTLESDTWFQLVNYPVGGARGINNLTRVFGADVPGQIRDWTIANYADDAVAGVAPQYTHPSWNTRSVEATVNSGAFPLKTRSMASGSQLALTLADGGAAYLRFGVGAGSVGGARFGTSPGGSPPAALSVSIIRTK